MVNPINGALFVELFELEIPIFFVCGGSMGVLLLLFDSMLESGNFSNPELLAGDDRYEPPFTPFRDGDTSLPLDEEVDGVADKIGVPWGVLLLLEFV